MDEIAQKLLKREIKGILSVVGCVNPRVTEDWVPVFEELSQDYLILTTGCQGFTLGQSGLLDGERFFHLGSCVNNSRVAEVFKRLAEKCETPIVDMPFFASSPDPISEKCVAICFYLAAYGIDVHMGYPFMLTSDSNIAHFLENVLKEQFHSKVFLETSPDKFLERMKTEGLAHKL
jgi:carbon-monoxide dehydrogenase catalytic subunit